MTAAPWRIALLRGVNVGGHGKLPMADLRAAMTDAGLAEVKTLLQSGNVVFRDEQAPADLEPALEALLAERFGLKTAVLVRDPAEWAALIKGNPFAGMAARDPSHLVVHLLREQPSADSLAALRAAITGPEEAELGERAFYMTYPDSIGRSTINQSALARVMGPASTARNWNTVLKLAAATAG
jgi:uncharacterized protein (DUF1697 family)